MNDLLKLALGAHGGLDRWKKVQAIKSQHLLRVPSGTSRARETSLRTWF
jgi:hypothetical protein